MVATLSGESTANLNTAPLQRGAAMIDRSDEDKRNFHHTTFIHKPNAIKTMAVLLNNRGNVLSQLGAAFSGGSSAPAG